MGWEKIFLWLARPCIELARKKAPVIRSNTDAMLDHAPG
jgi:hypothetical protein